MNSAAQALVVLGTIAISLALGGLAYFVNWAGPSFACGFLVGAAWFFCWYKIHYGKWP